MSSPIIKLKDAIQFRGCVLTYGHFTTIHPGHIRYLRHAKAQGEKLVVALIGDELSPQTAQPKYQFSQRERAESLGLLSMVDAVVMLNRNELTEAVKSIEPAMLVLGKEFEKDPGKEIKGAIELLQKQGRPIKFHAGEIHYANADLLSRSEKDLKSQRRKQFAEACRRQGLDLNKLITSMDAWKQTRLIVIGDTIVDQYAACEAVGMSAEAPVVVVRELERRNFIGGAAVVASHIRALGAKCDLISVVGEDNTAKLVQKELEDRKIGNGLISDQSRPTTFKKRYVVENQKLFRVSRLEDHSLGSKVEEQLIKKLEELAPKSQGIVVSDFVYGVVTEKILVTIQKLAREYNLMLFGDLQCSSQVGAVTKFKQFSLLCPNEREARVALQDKDIGLENLSQKLLSTTECNRLIMKLGPEGFIAYDRNEKGEIISQPFPALSVNPLDVAGAGDSLLAIMATGLSSKQNMMASAAIGCCMASLAVETMGNQPIPAESLKNNILEVLSND